MRTKTNVSIILRILADELEQPGQYEDMLITALQVIESNGLADQFRHLRRKHILERHILIDNDLL